MKVRSLLASLFLLPFFFAAGATVSAQSQYVLVVVGAPGEAQYAEGFASWAGRWQSAAELGDAQWSSIGLRDSETSSTDRDALQAKIISLAEEDLSELWLVLIGHGTFDGREAKFNLRGPDVSAQELDKWLEPLDGPTVIVNCASSSSPFMDRLARSNRIVVTSTKSGYEHNYSRFGDYLSSAVSDEHLDLDKDGQTSLLEAYLAAASQTQGFYDEQRRLATEHALIDDNGDGKGTPAEWFNGIRVVRRARDGSPPDGFRANQVVLIRRGAAAEMTEQQLQRRNELEAQLERLREQKSDLREDDYYAQVEGICLQLARLYLEDSEKEPGSDQTPDR